jgi:hypothetical protein
MKLFAFNPLHLVLLTWLLNCVSINAQEKFDHRSVIAPQILAMPAPEMWEGEGRSIGDLNIPVSTDDEMAEKHVRQGFALLHAQWDIEAYRNFAAALERDPDCLMAYCGIVLSLLNPQHEWKEYRAKAINRMVTLAEYKLGDGEDAEYVFPGNERDYAIAIGSLVVNGLESGAASFNKLAEKYPNDLQLSLLATFFNRGKYDVFGSSDEKQDQAVKAVKNLLEKNPDNLLVTNFYIMMLVEAPFNAVDQKTEVLPYAKKLVEHGGKDFPGWQMMLGYAAWRSGDLELARDAYELAVMQFEAWRKVSKAGISECDGLIRAYSFLSLIYFQLGDAEKLDAVLKKLEEVGESREGSAMHALHSWSHQMIRVNMFIAKGDKEAMTSALKSLPKIDTKDESKAAFNLMIKGYQAYGLTRNFMLDEKEEDTAKMSKYLIQVLEELSVMRAKIRNEPYYAQYLHLFQSLKVYQAELSAEMMGDVGAYNFYQEAIDLQMFPTRYFPPNILYPMEYKLAKFYEKKGDLKKARETYKLAVMRMPSHPESNAAYKKLMALLEE